nr:N-acetylmuramoyl-L-alanine amidase [Oscillibacter sp.]
MHQTGNFAKGADAAPTRRICGQLRPGGSGELALYRGRPQHLPTPAGLRAGLPRRGQRQRAGNATSIGIEICVDAGGDFEQARVNAAALVRLLMERHDIPLDRVVQHNRWNGKDCPKTIRTTAGAWEAFLALCGGQGSQDMDPELEAAVDTLAAAGIIDSPERWKALDFTANSVRLLLIKMGRYVTN